ncbi:hypothetical protein AaE_012198 [Aphanomyces astaci]|uniref:Uncharacterized protein n=1 Tax=Aphanomyces astaci TaxID=112090 RepID=A0A6A4ZPT1_APHAT|nr:hypothetical protein AaE_012198 [Aphanomyces astaci]
MRQLLVANVLTLRILGQGQGTDNLPPPHLDELDLIEVTLNQPLLSFDQFTALRPQLPPAAATYCTADVFMQLQPHDAHGRIYGLAWLAVVEQASAQVATYALLRSVEMSRDGYMNTDICDRGYLIESDVTGMVTTWLDTVPWTQSIDFFWRILDVHRCSTLNSDAIGYFLEDIAEAVFKATNEPLATADLRSELFDMIQPKLPWVLTFDDVWSSGRGHSFVRILTDHEAYLQYEHANAK